MINYILNLTLIGTLSFMLGIVCIPSLRKIAMKFSLVDKPNHRKVHSKPIPIIGGIAIAIIFFIILLLSGNFINVIQKYLPIFVSSTILLIVGIIDDNTDLKAKYKLIIQCILAIIIAHSGTRITSFHGCFGIHEINIFWQYMLTIVVTTGVVNAFNLMDGVDGLVGGLSFIGFSMFLIVGVFFNAKELITLSVLFMGCILSFLKYNLSTKNKIFLGDSGSLFLGLILVSLGINLLESQKISLTNNYAYAFLLLVSFFTIPVMDSIRVYINRINKGHSPFKADKSHLHHLLLRNGLTHKKITFYIVLMSLVLFFISFGLINFFSITLIVSILLIIFSIVIKIILMFNDLNYWTKKVKKIEK